MINFINSSCRIGTSHVHSYRCLAIASKACLSKRDDSVMKIEIILFLINNIILKMNNSFWINFLYLHSLIIKSYLVSIYSWIFFGHYIIFTIKNVNPISFGFLTSYLIFLDFYFLIIPCFYYLHYKSDDPEYQPILNV